MTGRNHTCFASILTGIVALFVIANAAEAARGTPGRIRQTRVVAKIRMDADTRVAQALVMINKDSQDGQWILASNANVPLLDRWRGEETAAAKPTETTVRAIRATAKRAGIEPTDTVIRVLDSRLKRDAELRRYREMGVIARDSAGVWRIVTSPDGEEPSLDALFAQTLVDEENADGIVLKREIERQERAGKLRPPR